jgi:signal transduction histidine kinase
MSLHDASFLRGPRQIICALRLLVLAGLVMIGTDRSLADPGLYWFLTVVYGVTILGYLWAQNQDYQLRRVKLLVFLFDVGMVSALIFLRGGDVSGFVTAYFGLVLMAAVMEGLGSALVNAVLVSVLYAALTNRGGEALDVFDFSVISQFVFFFIIAVFMGHVAQEARSEAVVRKSAESAYETAASELQRSTQDLKEARDALRASDRLATLGMLSAGIAHEMRSPLTAIQGSLDPFEDLVGELVDAVRTGGDLGAAESELLSIAHDCRHACAHLARVASDLTSVVRNSAARMAVVAPEGLLESAARMLRTRLPSGVSQVVRCDTRRELVADAGQLLQVLLNLGANALDAMEEGDGRTLVFAAEDAGPNRIALRVEDDGPGIAPEILDHIFEPFFTTKPAGRGTGLGLHVVEHIVKAHRGSIACESVLGGGTRFRLDLPVHTGSAPQESSHARQASHPADRGRRGADPQIAGAHAAAGGLRTVARV